MADNTTKTIEQAGDVIRLDHPFDYEGYQVVRQEFFAHVNEPAVTFNNYKFYGKTGTPSLGGRRNQKSRNRPPAACSSPRCLS